MRFRQARSRKTYERQESSGINHRSKSIKQNRLLAISDNLLPPGAQRLTNRASTSSDASRLMSRLRKVNLLPKNPFKLSLQGKLARLIYLALLTVFVGNFSLHPFGTSFRFSLAVVAFTFFLLLNDDINELVGGAWTGLAVLAFRSGGNVLLLELPLPQAIRIHYPAAVFYTVLGLGMWLTADVLRAGKWHSFILLGVLDVSANLFELAFRTELNLGQFLPIIYLLAVVALVRSTLVGLAFTAWRQHERILLQQQEKREFERILLVTSDVSGELLYLESTLEGLEKIMLKSYQLHNRLKRDSREGSEVALAISRDVHDAKKDFERLAARLRQVLVRQKEGESVDLRTLIDIALRANRDFARELSKDIEFHADVEGNVDVTSYHMVLSIINNLVGNAIEASGEFGEIRLQVDARHQRLLVVVSDKGSGIKSGDLSIIFTPGYTTKFDPATGKASTGLGLAQVKHIVDELGGEIKVESREGLGSRFAVNIPYSGRP